MRIYLIPGQGADYRLFNNLTFPDQYEVVHVRYTLPDKHCSMATYAKILAKQIDTDPPFILIGVSLGGMLAVEICELLNPQKTIIISSAKNRYELPRTYRFQSKIPVYKLIPPQLIWWGAKTLQPIVEPDSKKHKAIFKAIMNQKDPLFLKRTIHMIVQWERKSDSKSIIHLHGDNDRTIPYRNVISDHTICNGSHMMTLTQGEEISLQLKQTLTI